jgi:hypothetical protein
MKKPILILLAVAMTAGLLACGAEPTPGTTAPETTVPVTTVPETTVPETTIPETTEPQPEFYLEGCTLDDLLTYWDEVVLHVEYNLGTGDASVVQKWLEPIRCRIFGEPTDEDLRVLEDLFAELNRIDGFPGISLVEEEENLTLSFLDPDTFRSSFSDVVGGEDAWGATEFWYWTDTNDLYSARIGYRTDIDQLSRSSILVEEIINTLGITDTELREDSIVYQHSNENLTLSDEDWLILKLLYHPAIRPGMDMEECHRILTELYN